LIPTLFFSAPIFFNPAFDISTEKNHWKFVKPLTTTSIVNVISNLVGSTNYPT
jgi:hypothetical protein